jgi:hypothetical protein
MFSTFFLMISKYLVVFLNPAHRLELVTAIAAVHGVAQVVSALTDPSGTLSQAAAPTVPAVAPDAPVQK